jgi:ureidoglycolate lyase
VISPEPLTASAFQPFGEVIDMQGSGAELINDGKTEKFADLARLTPGAGGRIALHLYRSRAASLPIRISKMERHPLGSQAFLPLHRQPFPIVVCADSKPAAGNIRVFLSNGQQGINIRAGIWHHYQLSLGQASDYLVLDRVGEGDNLEVCELQEPLLLEL